MYCKVLGLTWGVWDEQIFTLCPNIILGADVLYETSGRFVPIFLFPIWWLFWFCFTYQLTGKIFLPRMHFEAFDDLFATVAFLLQNSPSSVFITAYHNRRWLWIFNSWSFLGWRTFGNHAWVYHRFMLIFYFSFYCKQWASPDWVLDG